MPRPAGGCFEPVSMDQLAGRGSGFGAVGSPDSTEVSDPAAHCDDADHLVGGYPRTLGEATTSLRDCVTHLRRRFAEAVDGAADLLDDEGRVVGAEVDLDADCELGPTEMRAKCTALEAFGRALHGVQDFYSHSNWTDVADPTRPIGAENPPGLSRPAPSSLLDLRGSGIPTVPRGLTTGCFVLPDRVTGVRVCERRVTHAALNKDTGTIDQRTGRAADPTTPRGEVGDNFARAVAGAVIETRHQWQELRTALRSAYGAERASLLACALTHDDPVSECAQRNQATSSGRVPAVAVVLVLLGALAASALLLRLRRRGAA
ncbi:CinY protein [Cryptosporangium minutisporangium]